jgi:hypothetical protein
VNRLHREGCLVLGWFGGWQWTRDGKTVASITLRAKSDRLHLSYCVRIAGGEWGEVEETVRVVRMPCRFGGSRPGRGERRHLRPASSKAARPGALFRVPTLLSSRPCEPAPGRMGPRA